MFESEPAFAPEVRGAVALAIRSVNRAAKCYWSRYDRERRAKWRRKAQKHIARALKYQARREGCAVR